MQIVADEEGLRHYLKTAVEIDEDKPVLVDKYISGKEHFADKRIGCRGDGNYCFTFCIYKT